MNKKKIFVLIVSITLFQSCATTSFKEEIFRNMAVASIAGFAVGTMANKNVKGYGYQYAGLAAATAAVVTTLHRAPDHERRELQAKLKFINDIETQKSKNISSDMPEDLKNLVDTHHYDVYRINRWTQRGPKLLVKESEAIELKEVKTNEE